MDELSALLAGPLNPGTAKNVEPAPKRLLYMDAFFLDNTTPSAEAKRKWRKRREDEIVKERRQVPLNAVALVGDIFSQCGVDVLFSADEDNDDTLCSYAQAHGAAVLSGDQDMFRYIDSTFEVYSQFVMDYASQTLILHRSKKMEKDVEERPLILDPLPITVRAPAQLYQLATHAHLMCGVPSALFMKLGNLHSTIRPLRQALYKRLGYDSITELMPLWDSVNSCVIWDETIVGPDGALDKYLDSPAEAFDHFFPARSLIKPRDDIADLDWRNHLYAMHSIVYYTCVVANPTGSSLLDLLLPVSERALGTPLSNRRHARVICDITLPCQKCDKSFILSGREQEALEKKKYDMPKRCQKCRRKRPGRKPK
ncbi:hypothetical protein BDZ88DRAFT_448298 [Geranomyces variabilis]|nr:hypothetical protein BDZ88DRAFT_448298 [Geranomyces variabilis]KAJ3143541.1 hypothetical protein HDU90_000304 [Geranomyces variabilis]